MIMDHSVIRQPKRSDGVPTKPLGGHTVEKLGVAVAEFKLPDRASFFPIEFFVVEKCDQVLFQNDAEICFRHC